MPERVTGPSSYFASTEKEYGKPGEGNEEAAKAIERMIDEDPDLAPRTETLVPLLEARDVRRKLGLTPAQFANKLGMPVETIRAWERDETPTEPVLQALLRILDRMPKSALRALDQKARKTG